MMKNLKVDPSSEAIDSNVAASKDGSPFDATSCISSSGDATSSFQESDVDHESLIAEQGIYYPASNYYGYCYPGAFDGVLELLVCAGRSLPEAIMWKGTLLKQFMWKAVWQFVCFENFK
ncbi:uncharacterized protein LOC131224036 isoform X1 [Magnolia sinica]|uniref:uncharacterized protein LOC131224036 isoform X1 n=1 Tax=Magnolia sinica TaxID=86752 RepID=UPI002658537B|nr:uncharacterized protein LOC131224036 isoform X1 [Magnolia sinica]